MSPMDLRLPLPALWLALFVGAWACGSGVESELDGEWLVDFGPQQGVLSFRRGIVYAWCYGPEVEVGRYALDGNRLDLQLQLEPFRAPRDLSGTVSDATDAGFELRVGGSLRGRPLAFRRYVGDCSSLVAEHRDAGPLP